MIDKLDQESRKELIRYKIDKSQDTLKEADLLASGGFYNAAVNRLYYAAYYAASALILSDAIEAATHKGIKTMLGLKYIQTGKLDKEYGRIYQRLFESRQAGDYEDFIYYDSSTYAELLPMAEKFIKAVKSLLALDEE